MPETIRVARDDWPEECKRLHREGLTIRQLKEDPEDRTFYLATVAPRMEFRAEPECGA